MSITKCPKCNFSLIEEEISNHICHDIIDYKIENNIAYFFDGERWYPVTKLTTNRYLTGRNTNREANRTRYKVLF